MQRLRALAAATFVLASAACAHRPTPSQGAASPTPAVKATLAPARATPSPAASTPSPTPSPTLSPTPAPVVTLPPNAPPRIVAVHLSAQTVHGGDTISGTVETTSNVASLEARIATFSISVPKIGVGRFALNYQVPNVPFFLHGTYPMTLLAHNTAGQTVERVIPITVQ
jgi:hypothetical protein